MHEWADHTGELELHVSAATERDVFGEASEAIADLLGEPEAGETVRRTVVVRAADAATLLAEWLGELVWLAERERLIPVRVAELRIDAGTAEGTVELCAGRPRDLVKAVTYHRLECRPDADGWWASVVFDV